MTLAVPRSALPRGIRKCLEVVGARLDEAMTLIDNGFANQAAIVFSFAVEEFGKAALLWAAHQTEADPATIRGFRNHDVKLEEAAKHISEEHRVLSPGFDRKDFDPDDFVIATTADASDRFAGLYVEWSDGDWRYGIAVDPETLKNSIHAVNEDLKSATANWLT